MKKLFITLSIFAISVCGFSQMKFETISSNVNVNSIVAFSKGEIIDSTQATCTARFGIVGNPYTKGESFTAYAVIKMTLKGDARVSDFQKEAWVVAEAYRIKKYPDIK